MFELSQQLIAEFLEGIKQELLAYLELNNRNASGRSAASLQVSADATSGQLTGGSWIYFTFSGRGPGKMPPLINIIEWCVSRGLPRGMAWGIARKIAENGTKLWQSGRNILDETITEAKIEDFKQKLLVTFTAEVKYLIAA